MLLFTQLCIFGLSALAGAQSNSSTETLSPSADSITTPSSGLPVIVDTLPPIISTATQTIPDTAFASSSSSEGASVASSASSASTTILPTSAESNSTGTGAITSTIMASSSRHPYFPNSTTTATTAATTSSTTTQEPASSGSTAGEASTSTILSTYTDANGNPTSTATSYVVVPPSGLGSPTTVPATSSETASVQTSLNAGIKLGSLSLAWDCAAVLVAVWYGFLVLA